MEADIELQLLGNIYTTRTQTNSYTVVVETGEAGSRVWLQVALVGLEYWFNVYKALEDASMGY